MKKFLKGLACVAGLTLIGAALTSWLIDEAENQEEGEKK